MTAVRKRAVALCGATRTDLDEIEKVLRREDFDVHPIVWTDRRALDVARSLPAEAYVLVGAPPAGLVPEIGRTIVVAIGGPPLSSSACWFAKPPSGAVLAGAVRDLLPRAEEAGAGRTWRRKSDIIVGRSAPVQQLLAVLDRLAPSVAPVLITGESGTGKELVARALHYGGPRSGAPFVPIHCAAIPESLFEAELFGYQRGAFTGAVASRPGALESAQRGTVFLDEIGEIPLSMQVKLLRVLETGEVTRLGSNEARKLDVRIVAATNRKLEEAVRSGRFREDLFYRVSVYPVHLPPLRDRADDIPLIAGHYLEEIARREKRAPIRLARDAVEKLLSHAWPGNVRELVNALERAALTAPGAVIAAEHIVLPESASPIVEPYREAKDSFELDYYARLLRASGGNVSLAAKLARKTRKEVYYAMRRIRLDVDEYREAASSAPPPWEDPAAHAAK